MDTYESDVLVEAEEYQDGGVGPPSYLFESRSGRVEFVKLQDDMEQLNSFSVLCINATDKKLREYETQLRAYEIGNATLVDPSVGDVTAEAILGVQDFDLPMWRDNQTFLVRAMCLLLLAVYIEKSLRSLCEELAPDGMRSPKRARSSMSKADAYLVFLKDDIGLSFIEPKETYAIRERCRKLRNDFAHGEWDEVRKTINEQSLRDAFNGATALLTCIEESALR